MPERHHQPESGQHREKGQRRLQATIAGLRLCNAAQDELIANFEEYQRRVMGVGYTAEEVPGGYQGSYGAELVYLHSRRHAIESLIAAVERYHSISHGFTPDQEEMVAE